MKDGKASKKAPKDARKVKARPASKTEAPKRKKTVKASTTSAKKIKAKEARPEKQRSTTDEPMPTSTTKKKKKKRKDLAPTSAIQTEVKANTPSTTPEPSRPVPSPQTTPAPAIPAKLPPAIAPKPISHRIKIDNGRIVRQVFDFETRPKDRKQAMAAVRQFRNEGDATGQLIFYVPNPSRVPDARDEETGFDGSQMPPYITCVHYLAGRLTNLSVEFSLHAQDFNNEEADAIAHILLALHKAIHSGDIRELKEKPYNWARSYLRGDGPPLPSEAADHKPQRPHSIAGRFRELARTIEWIIEEVRARGPVQYFPNVGHFLTTHFPMIESLRGGNDDIEKLGQIDDRVSKKLPDLITKYRAFTPSDAAKHIAEDFLREECKRSKMSDPEIKTLFHFLDNKPREKP